jgi:SSS family solute:Na+ symporter
MQPQFSSLDITILVLYFLSNLVIGIYFWKSSRSVEGFTTAHRNLPGWLCGISILASYVSSISFIALPGKAFAANWNPFVFSLSIPLAIWICARWFIPYYRKHGHVSAYTHLEQRFGSWARIYASSCYLLTQIVRIGMIIYLASLPVATLLRIDIRWIILTTGIITTAYTFIGGIGAVVWTEAIHTVILVVGALICSAMLMLLQPEGPSQIFRLASQYDKFSLGSLSFDLSQPTFWVVLAFGLVINLYHFGTDQTYVQRYIAARSETEARKGIWLGGLLYLPLSAVFLFIGTALFAFYTAYPADLPPELRSSDKSDGVFPWFIVTVLPSGVNGLLVASIFAAAMSAVSSQINSSATIVLADYFKRYVNRNMSDRASMMVLYGSTLAFGIGGTVIGLLLIRTPSALDAWWSAAGLLAGCVLGLFLLGVMSQRATSAVALCALGVGLTIMLWMSLSPQFLQLPDCMRNPFHKFLIMFMGNLGLLVTGFTVCNFLRPRPRLATPA